MWSLIIEWGILVIQSIGMVIARLYPCFFLIPLFSFYMIKGLLRLGILFSLSFFMFPIVYSDLLAHQWSLTWFLVIVFKEMFIGTLLGILLAMPFWLFESIGGLFDNQRGVLMGGQINASMGQDDFTPLGYTFKQLAILLMILGGGMPLITQLLWYSYQLWPVAKLMPFPSYNGFLIYIEILEGIFVSLILYAAPLVVFLLLIDFSVGVLNIFNAQLQATILTIPLKCVLGVIFLIVYLSTLTYFMEVQINLLRYLHEKINLILHQ